MATPKKKWSLQALYAGTMPADAQAALLAWLLERCVDDAGCLRWTGAINNAGHPVVRLDGQAVVVRRVLHALQRAPLRPGQRLIMRCECRACVLVDHMHACATHGAMMREASRQGRLATPLRALKTARALRARSRWSDADIAAFRAAEGTVLERAARFGMSPTYAYLVHRGEARQAMGSPLSPWNMGAR